MKSLLVFVILLVSSYSMACEFPAVELPDSMSCVAIECTMGDCSPALDSYDVRFIDLSNSGKARLRYEPTASEAKIEAKQYCDNPKLMLFVSGTNEIDQFTAKKSDMKKLVSGRSSSIEMNRGIGFKTDNAAQVVRYVTMECLVTD